MKMHSKASWEKVLMEKGVVNIPYEAMLRTEVAQNSEGKATLNFIAEYFIVDGGLEIKTLKSIDEIKSLIKREPAFRTCSCCNELIFNDFFSDYNTDKDYCSKKCLTEDLNRIYGEGNWRAPVDSRKLIKFNEDIREYEIDTSEYTIVRIQA